MKLTPVNEIARTSYDGKSGEAIAIALTEDRTNTHQRIMEVIDEEMEKVRFAIAGERNGKVNFEAMRANIPLQNIKQEIDNLFSV
jgi:hypothetical protein